MSRRGDPGEHYADALSYALSMANRPAFSRHMIHAALMKDTVVLDYQQEHGDKRAAAFAWTIVDKAIERTVEHPVELWKAEVPRRIQRYREAADQVGLSATDRRVAEGLYLTGFLARSTDFTLSARTHGLRVGLPAMKVSRSMKRLQSKHIVRVQLKHTMKIAARYRLRSVTRGLPPQGGSLVTLGVSLVDEDGFERRVLRHDAFRRAALGDEGWLFARQLSDEVPILPEFAVANDAVATVVATLEAAGAIRRTRRGWVRTLEPFFFAALDEIAATAGTAGDLERDRERYQAERDRRDAGLEDRSGCALFVTVRDPFQWWSTWWGSLLPVGNTREATDAA